GEHRKESNGGRCQRSRRSQPMWLRGQMRTNARPTTSERWIGPKTRESWELPRLSPITNSWPGPTGPVFLWPSVGGAGCGGGPRRAGAHQRAAPAGDLGAGDAADPLDEVAVRGRDHADGLAEAGEEAGHRVAGAGRLEARLLGDEHDHVAALDVAEAVGQLLDQHPVRDVEGGLHRPRGDVEGRDQEGLE